MTNDSWVIDALQDWGQRHRGAVGAEVGYKRRASFAHLIRDRWNASESMPAMPPTQWSCEVDAAVSYLRAPNGRHSEQGELESNVLELVYCVGLEQRVAARILGVSHHRVRNAKLTGEASVKMYLQARCGWGEVNPSLMVFA